MQLSLNKIQDVFLLLLTFFYVMSTQSLAKSFTPQLTKPSTQALRIITVNEPPASYLSADKLPQGYAVDIVKALKTKLNIKTPIEFMPEARALNIARNRPNVLLFSFSRTLTREDNYLWVGQLLSKRWFVFTLSSSNLIVDSYKKLSQVPKIGVVRGDIREEWLVNNKFENLYSVTHHKQNIKMLLENRVSVIVFDNAGLTQVCNELSLDPQTFSSQLIVNDTAVYLAMSLKTPHETYEVFQHAFQELTDEGVIHNTAQQWKIKLKQEFNIDSQLADGILSL